MALIPGTRVGAYEITAQIGVGGMGEVYRAIDTHLGRDVAIKVLPEAFAQDADRLARFEREAKTLASLNHPNIAIVYGFEKGPAEAGHYVRALVMELVEGQTLADVIERRAGPSGDAGLPLDEALPIARQIAEALEAAHEQGVVHRDLKPANVKVRDDGTVKVLDFGLAKIVEETGRLAASGYAGPTEQVPAYTASPTITTPAMTQIGVILGTAAYMAPEQARGKGVDKRTDIWAFGCVLFEMLTGTRAFDGEDTTDTIAAVVRAEPKWDALPANTPASIRLLLRRCLEKDRKKRIGDISTVLFILNEPVVIASGNATDVPAVVTRAPSVWSRAMPVVVGAALTAAIAGGVAWRLRPLPATPGITRFSFALPQGQQFTNTGRPVVAISPDGSRIVYIANRRLYLRSMLDTTPREIQGSEDPDGITTPTFSPDGQWIAFVSSSDQAIKRISVDGGVPIRIAPIQGSLGLSWDADGILFGQRPGNIFRVASGGGKPQVVLTPAKGEAAYGARKLPDGESILVTIGARANLGDTADPNPDQLRDPRVVLVSTRSGTQTTLIEHGADARYIPTGHIVYADGGALLAVRFDLERRQVTGDAVPIIEGLRRGNASPAGQFSVANNGSLVYLPGSASAGQSLVFVDRQGRVDPLKVTGATYNVPRVSPDGKRIAVEIDDGKAANIWIYDVSGTSSIRQLTLHGNNRFPIWSADGEHVAFASDRSGELAIWWQRADGNGAAEQLTQPDKGSAHAPVSWHPREQMFLFVARRSDQANGGSSLWTYSLKEKKAKPFAGVESSQNLSAQFSPDGRWVAYHSVAPPSNRATVFVRPYPNTDATVYSVAPGSHPMWSPNGSELFFARASTLFVTRVTTNPSFATGVAATVPAPLGATAFWRRFDMTPDGRLLTVVPGTGSEAGESAAQVEVVLNWTEELKRLVPVR